MENSAKELCSLNDQCFIEDCDLWHVSYEDGKAPSKTKLNIKPQSQPSLKHEVDLAKVGKALLAFGPAAAVVGPIAYFGVKQLISIFKKQQEHSKSMKEEIIEEDLDSTVNQMKQFALMEMMESGKHEESKEEADLIKQQTDEKYCKICLTEVIETDQVYKLSNCSHKIHADCIKEYLKNEIAEWKFPLKCPICRVELDRITDLKALLDIDEQKLVEMRERDQGLMQMKGFTRCPTVDCPESFFYEIASDNPKFRCSICQKHYCLKCRMPFHFDLTCAENQAIQEPSIEDAEFKEMLRREGLKQCPFCMIFVQKQDGCSHIKCICGNEFCFNCGGLYGKCECVRAVMNTNAFKEARRA
ncbi:hypothetical protein FGO68_gene8065 [Halteria grandinella]|uniref:RING-type domain-containing protein n=1 Tax=Halteria grandinella TaxID=5974 RepID=A0A8J8NNY8_HALGN|nr:hypothetical protein FGO68_gene8065 [Halteria grandinella]